MKGSMEGVLPMLALLILSIGMATQAIPLAEALSQIVGDSTDDINRVVDTRAYTDFYFYNYIPLNSQYSTNDVSYDLGQDGGGPFDWNNDWIAGNPFSQIYSEWKRRSNSLMNSRVNRSEGRCFIPESQYYNTPFDNPDADDTTIIVGSGQDASNRNPIQGLCNTSSRETKYISDEESYKTMTDATNNRYSNMAYETVQAFKDIREELAKLSGNDYGVYMESACGGSPVVEEAERASRSNLHGAVEGAISEGLIGVPTRSYLNLYKRPDENYYISDPGWSVLDSGDVRREGTTNSWTTKCNCDPDGGGCSTRYHTEVVAKPKRVKMDWSIRDREYSTIVRGENKKLEFIVSPYDHEW